MCEFQNAFKFSRSQTPITNHTSRIKAAVASGQFVVVEHASHYCRFTNAVIGESITLISHHDTREEAEGELPSEDQMCSDLYYQVQPILHRNREEESSQESIEDDDIPF